MALSKEEITALEEFCDNTARDDWDFIGGTASEAAEKEIADRSMFEREFAPEFTTTTVDPEYLGKIMWDLDILSAEMSMERDVAPMYHLDSEAPRSFSRGLSTATMHVKLTGDPKAMQELITIMRNKRR